MITSTMFGQFFYWNRSTGKGACGYDRHCKAIKSLVFSKDVSLTLLYVRVCLHLHKTGHCYIQSNLHADVWNSSRKRPPVV